jgi:hypothetical protein
MAAMARPCLTCHHPERLAIDEALIRGEPRAAIARRFGLSDDTLDRHWHAEHVEPTVRARLRAQEADRLAALSDEMCDAALRLVRRRRVTAADVSAAARVAEVRARLEGRFGDVRAPGPRVKGRPGFDLGPILDELAARGALPPLDTAGLQ